MRLVFAFTVLTLVPSAWAGSNAPSPSSTAGPSPSDKELARQAFADAVKLFEAADYAGALAKFSTAHVLVPISTVRFNVARCQEKLGRTATAWAEYKATAADAKSEGKTTIETNATEAAIALAPKVPYLTVVASPADASVKIDGDGASSNVAVAVDPGTHVVTVSKGAKSKKVTVVMADSDKKKLAVAL